jgi:hypothetical protein
VDWFLKYYLDELLLQRAKLCNLILFFGHHITNMHEFRAFYNEVSGIVTSPVCDILNVDIYPTFVDL